jgi:hypothetical protein
VSSLSGLPEHTDRPSCETAHESDGNTCIVSSIDDIASRCPTTGNRDEQKKNHSLGGTCVPASMHFDDYLQEKKLMAFGLNEARWRNVFSNGCSVLFS